MTTADKQSGRASREAEEARRRIDRSAAASASAASGAGHVAAKAIRFLFLLALGVVLSILLGGIGIFVSYFVDVGILGSVEGFMGAMIGIFVVFPSVTLLSFVIYCIMVFGKSVADVLKAGLVHRSSLTAGESAKTGEELKAGEK